MHARETTMRVERKVARRRSTWLGVAAGLAAVLAGARPVARAAAPQGFPLTDLWGTCKGGSDEGAACGFTVPCVDSASKCAPKFLKGPNTTLRGTLTVVIDDIVKDWSTGLTVYPPCPPSAEAKPRRAVTMILEVKHAGKPYVFAETYQSPSCGGWPKLSFPRNAVVPEFELSGQYSACEGWLDGAMHQPEASVAQQLLGIAGISTVARPVIEKATAALPLVPMEHFAFNDEIGSVVKCKVRIKFLEGLAISQP